MVVVLEVEEEEGEGDNGEKDVRSEMDIAEFAASGVNDGIMSSADFSGRVVETG